MDPSRFPPPAAGRDRDSTSVPLFTVQLVSVPVPSEIVVFPDGVTVKKPWSVRLTATNQPLPYSGKPVAGHPLVQAPPKHSSPASMLHSACVWHPDPTRG